MLIFMCLFIIMSISAKRHELWCTVRDMRLSKRSIIIIIIYIADKITLISHGVTLRQRLMWNTVIRRAEVSRVRRAS